MIERSKIVAVLLTDGLERGLLDNGIQHIMQRMQLHIGDAIKLIPEFISDVIYLDPMFPLKSNKALVKKEMKVFQDLLGDDTDSSELLRIALQHAKYRVVVKRPRKAPAITGIIPSYKLEGSACRFDVYQLNSAFAK
jgi:16S rRNA (guanine1516-N2)-methyltransferase